MLIFSLTTIPERLDTGLTQRCIESLVSQTMPADIILVNIPERTRSNREYNRTRAFDLEKISSKVKVNWGVKDDGPITKLVGALDYGSSKSLLVLIDDDVIVEPNAVATLHAARSSNAAVGFKSRDAVIDVVTKQVIDTPWRSGLDGAHHEGQLVQTTFLETSWLVMYRFDVFLPPHSFKKWLASFDEATVRVADDIIIGAWLHHKGIVPYRLASTMWFSKHDPQDTPQLMTLNVYNGNNNVVFQKLLDQGYFSQLLITENSEIVPHNVLSIIMLFVLFLVISIYILTRIAMFIKKV